MGMEYIETSAKNSTNVDEAFLMLTRQIKERMKCESPSDEDRDVKPNISSRGKLSTRCSCC